MTSTTGGDCSIVTAMTGEPLGGIVRLDELLATHAPTETPSWTWDDTERDILGRECMCCGVPGHYQHQLETFIAEHGLDGGVCLGDNGVVWDGHHRIIAARRLGIPVIPLESRDDADTRWLNDHGPVGWDARTFGDRPVHDCWQCHNMRIRPTSCPHTDPQL